MTAFWGAVALREPLEPDQGQAWLDCMGRAEELISLPAAYRAEVASHVQAGVALACRLRAFTAEEADLHQVLRQGLLCLVARCRLDNRQALLGHGSAGRARGCSDAALILAAYERHGLACVDHLRGDWAFALWDGARQRLLLARDPTGNSALFWWHRAGTLVFSSNLRSLIAAPPVPARANPHWLAELMTGFADPAHAGESAFEEVHSLVPGHLLVLDDQGLQLRRWWQPEQLPALSGPSDELEAQFLQIYRDAVSQRLRSHQGQVALTLSGGLDSGSVAALAAPMLAQRGLTLQAYVHVPRFEPDPAAARRTGNEWPLALATAQHVGHIDARACASERCSPVAALRQWLDICVAPSSSPANWYWMLDLLTQARAAGARVMLTGQGGNATVSFNGNGNLWPMLRRGQLAQTWTELRTEEAGLASAFKQRLLKPALRPAWKRFKRARAQAPHQPGWSVLAALQPELVERLGLNAVMREAGHDATFSTISNQRLQRWRLGLHRGGFNAGGLWAELGEALDLDVRDPTRDQRLVEFCWRLPDEVFWAHGRERGLIRHAMQDQLPAQVLASRRKGLQSSDLTARLRDCAAELMDELEAVASHPTVCAWMDVPRLQASAIAIVQTNQSPVGTLPAHLLLRHLAVAMFVARYG